MSATTSKIKQTILTDLLVTMILSLKILLLMDNCLAHPKILMDIYYICIFTPQYYGRTLTDETGRFQASERSLPKSVSISNQLGATPGGP